MPAGTRPTTDVSQPAHEGELVRAAGGVVWRRRPDGGGQEIVLVHRGRYDDWSFPKGKLDPGESWEEAAVREVREETGILPLLGHELASTEYVDSHGRPKLARYWAMAVGDDTGFTPNDEIDAREWMPVADVAARLSYDRDRAVLESFLRSTE